MIQLIAVNPKSQFIATIVWLKKTKCLKILNIKQNSYKLCFTTVFQLVPKTIRRLPQQNIISLDQATTSYSHYRHNCKATPFTFLGASDWSWNHGIDNNSNESFTKWTEVWVLALQRFSCLSVTSRFSFHRFNPSLRNLQSCNLVAWRVYAPHMMMSPVLTDQVNVNFAPCSLSSQKIVIFSLSSQQQIFKQPVLAQWHKN